MAYSKLGLFFLSNGMVEMLSIVLYNTGHNLCQHGKKVSFELISVILYTVYVRYEQ